MGDKEEKAKEKAEVKVKKIILSPGFIAAKKRDLDIEVAKRQGGVK